MTFEFLIACWMTPETDIHQVLTELLATVLEDHQNDFDEAFVAEMVQLRYERKGGEVVEGNDLTYRHSLVDFAIELPNEAELMSEVIDAFAKSLPETPPVFHAVKFEDPLLQVELTEWAKEIFSLEMKLRRVLSLVYLHAYQDGDPFDLLREEVEQPTGRKKPNQDQMQKANENQFFHLTFREYINLNKRPAFGKVANVLELISNSDHYDALRAEILRVPVEDEGDAHLLADLKSLMDSIDKMRNCVAHNRRPPKEVAANYPSAREGLEQRLDEYLASLAKPDNTNW